MKQATEIIGIFATIITIFMYMPQTWKVIKTKTSGDLKKSTYLIIFFVCIIFILWSPMIHPKSLPAFLCNTIVALLILFIFYYMFKEKIYIFWIMCLFWLLILIFTILQFIILNFNYPSWLSLTTSILVGSLLIIAFLLQNFNVIKNKKIGHISIIGIFIIILGNIIWITYWILSSIIQWEDSKVFQIASTSFLTIVQIPTIYFYYKKK